MWTPDTSAIITAEQKQSEANAAARLAAFPNLEPDQFWFVIRVSGYEEELREWLDNMLVDTSPNYDPILWAGATAKLDFAKYFERDHPLIETARESLGIPTEELDALWQYGATS